MGKRKTSASQRIYAVYDSQTDDLLALGTADQCTKLLEYKDEVSFRKMVWLSRHGKYKKYTVVVMDGYREDDI